MAKQEAYRSGYDQAGGYPPAEMHNQPTNTPQYQAAPIVQPQQYPSAPVVYNQQTYPAFQGGYQPHPAGSGIALDTPPTVVVGDGKDSVSLEPKNTILLVVCCACGIFAVFGVISIIVTFTVAQLIGTILVFVVSMGCAFFCREILAEFNKQDRVFRLLRSRLIFALCEQRDVLVDVPFASLGEPYADIQGHVANGGAIVTIWLPIQGHPNVKLIAFRYTSDVDLQRDLEPWKSYIGRIRNFPPGAAQLFGGELQGGGNAPRV
jgi:hypothetical protein